MDLKLNKIFKNKNISDISRGPSDFIKEIDTTVVERLEIDGKETFTLRVITDNDSENRFYNIIIYNINGVYYNKYIKYEGLDNQREGVEKLINSTKTTVDENGAEVASLTTENGNNNRDNCTSFAPIWQCSNGNPHSPDQGHTPACSADFWFVIGFIEISIPCGPDAPNNNPTNPSGNENGNYNPNQQPGQTYGSGNSSGSNPNNTNTTGGLYGNSGTYTIPVMPVKTDKQIRLAFKATLNSNQLAWWNNPLNKTVVDKIVMYLTDSQFQVLDENYVNPETFIKEIINELNNNNTIINLNLFDDQIISDLPPCLQNILNDLKTLNNGKFGMIMKKFIGDNPAPVNYNVNFTLGSLSPATTGSTSPTISNNMAVITLNQNYTNLSTDLSWATTMIHESFHAYLVSVYRIPSQSADDKSYVALIDKYWEQFKHKNNPAQHNLIAENNIIPQISLAIKEYGVLKGYNLSQQFCDDMAWSGLNGTKAWDGLEDDERDRITSRLNAELFNSSNNSLNPLGFSPKGSALNCQ